MECGTATTQEGGAVAHLNPEGGPLHAATHRGINDHDTIATSEDPIRNPQRGRYRSGSMGNIHRAVGRYIRDEGRAPEGVSKGGDTGKGTRRTTVIESGKLDKTGFPRGAPTGGAELDNNGATT